MHDRWAIMNNSASELDTKQHKHQRCCRVLLWSTVVLVAMTIVVTGTLTVLYLYEYQLPYIYRGGALASVGPPIISTNQKELGALVTVSRGDSQPVGCPDYSGQSTGLVHKMGEELKMFAGHSHKMRQEVDWLKRGQVSLGRSLETLYSEQSQVIQVLADRQEKLLKLLAQVSDTLLDLQRETESLTTHRPDNTWQAIGFRAQDCSELLAAGATESGVYSVFPAHTHEGFMVYCDMAGGWTVFQRRQDGSVNFYRDWSAYRDGFGHLRGEHWLGLQRLYDITRSAPYELRIDMADFENATAFAHYARFAVGLDCVNADEDGYPLTVEGYSGTAGDSLLKHSGMRFTTRDRDQDQSENNCAAFYQGAWWYRSCHTSNLNGRYLAGAHASYADGVEWSSWTGWQYSLRLTEMKIRPRGHPASSASTVEPDASADDASAKLQR